MGGGEIADVESDKQQLGMMGVAGGGWWRRGRMAEAEAAGGGG